MKYDLFEARKCLFVKIYSLSKTLSGYTLIHSAPVLPFCVATFF